VIETHDVLADLFDQAKLKSPTRDYVSFSGPVPPLPTRFLLGHAGAAIISAAGAAAAHLWFLRSGVRQLVNVNIQSAIAGLRSDYYCRVNGKKLPDHKNPMHGFYSTRDDRWIQIHCTQPHHRDGIISFFNGIDNRESIEKSIAKSWNAFDLEDALTEAQLCAGVVRRREEWMQHDHGKAVSKLPLFEIMRIGDSPPEPLPKADRPLSGIRVIDLTHVIAGPVGGRTLAEHGADVLRLNAPHRHLHKQQLVDFGHGKRSSYVDLHDAGGIGQLNALIKTADVFLQGYRPHAIAGRGFSPETLATNRPGIICVDLSAYGHQGPWRNKRGFDSLVQSVSGMVDKETVRSNSLKPRHLPLPALDYCTGYLIGFATMAALARRATEGGSFLIKLSLCQTGHWIYNLGLNEEKIDSANCRLPEYEDLQGALIDDQGPFGLVRHLAPIAKLSETPTRWTHASAPYGTHAPEWIT